MLFHRHSHPTSFSWSASQHTGPWYSGIYWSSQRWIRFASIFLVKSPKRPAHLPAWEDWHFASGLLSEQPPRWEKLCRWLRVHLVAASTALAWELLSFLGYPPLYCSRSWRSWNFSLRYCGWCEALSSEWRVHPLCAPVRSGCGIASQTNSLTATNPSQHFCQEWKPNLEWLLCRGCGWPLWSSSAVEKSGYYTGDSHSVVQSWFLKPEISKDQMIWNYLTYFSSNALFIRISY